MPEAFASAVIPAPPDRVWSAVRAFGDLADWHPAIATSELDGDSRGDQVGATRTLELAGDGGRVREVLTVLDDRDRALTYEILESPFSVRLYRSTLRVVPVTTTGESFAEWRVVFDCETADIDQLTALFRDGVFAAGLEGLASHLRDG